MTIESQLFERRKDELTRLIDAHLAGDSLDEGNATAFDAVIEAWLSEEVTRLDDALAAAAHDEAANRAAAEVERHHRRTLEMCASRRWQLITEAHQSARQAALATSQTRHDERVRLSAERLDQARVELVQAREFLMGGMSSSQIPGSTPHETEAPNDTALGNDYSESV